MHRGMSVVHRIIVPEKNPVLHKAVKFFRRRPRDFANDLIAGPKNIDLFVEFARELL